MKEILYLLTALLLAGCIHHDPKHPAVGRDYTITPANSFSELFLDSGKTENFLADQQMADSDVLAMRNCYNVRNYQYVWFTADGLAEHTRAFWNLHQHYIRTTGDSAGLDRRLAELMEPLINWDTLPAAGSAYLAETELRLTRSYLRFSRLTALRKMAPEAFSSPLPKKRERMSTLLDSLTSDVGPDVQRVEAVNQPYQQLKSAIERYQTIQQSGGWPVIAAGKKKSYTPGDSSVTIQQVKQCLRIVGDYQGKDTGKYFIADLLPAVKQARKRFGLKQDGIIDTALIRQLNIPAQQRIAQMLINLERMRWLPQDAAGNRIFANIPEFRLHVLEKTAPVLEMDVVVGAAAHQTVVFNDILQYIVFAPYWNIPRSIVRDEILPAIKKDKDYLAKNNMEQTGFSNGLPVIRQKPGGNNALGKVKFLFPNSYNIYFHDTPLKSLFNEQNRAFSHGCIRLRESRQLADYLLRHQPEWTAAKITAAMNATTEKWVTLKEQLPVSITYFTSWVGSDGLLYFRQDVYGNDKEVAKRLFEPDSGLIGFGNP